RFFRHHRERVPYTWSDGTPTVGKLYAPELALLLGPERDAKEPLEQRHRDVARSAQALYEEAFFHLLNQLHARYRVGQLTLAGGGGMTSVANGKVRLRSPFRNVYVQAAAGDAGGAIGAALWVEARQARPAQHKPMLDAYLGPSFSRAEISAL